MSEMIDRVAIAIVNAMEASLPVFTQQSWDELSGPARASYRKRARAAIEAMRDIPPEFAQKVMEGGSDLINWLDDPKSGEEWFGDFTDFKKGWNAAIDEALK